MTTSAFSKGSSLFKLKYTSIDVRKDVAGNLKRIELNEESGVTSTLIHSCQSILVPPITHRKTNS